MAQATLSCPSGAIHLESDRGLLPVSTLPAAVLTVIAPGPPVTGACPFGYLIDSGGQNQDLFPFYSRALGPFAIKICEGLLLSYTAWCLPTCLVWQSLGKCPATAQLPWLCQSRRCPYSANTLNFRLVGPKARGKKNARSCVRSRRTQMPNPQEGVPRKRGSRGCGDYEHPPAARCSLEPHPLAHLWLLSVRAESNTRPPNKKPQPVYSDCGFVFKKNDYSPFTTKLGRLPSWMSFTLFHILLCARRKEPPVLPPRWGE